MKTFLIETRPLKAGTNGRLFNTGFYLSFSGTEVQHADTENADDAVFKIPRAFNIELKCYIFVHVQTSQICIYEWRKFPASTYTA